MKVHHHKNKTRNNLLMKNKRNQNALKCSQFKLSPSQVFKIPPLTTDWRIRQSFWKISSSFKFQNKVEFFFLNACVFICKHLQPTKMLMIFKITWHSFLMYLSYYYTWGTSAHNSYVLCCVLIVNHYNLID